MNNILILADTRQKSDNYITDYFNKNGIKWLRATLKTGDYMALRFENGFIIDATTIIDTKKDVAELVGNLCKTSEHERILREIQRAKEFGCKHFIFLVCDNKIRTLDDLKNWHSTRTKVKGETLLKIIKTMAVRYDIQFIFTSKDRAGAKIIELLQKK